YLNRVFPIYIRHLVEQIGAPAAKARDHRHCEWPAVDKEALDVAAISLLRRRGPPQDPLHCGRAGPQPTKGAHRPVAATWRRLLWERHSWLPTITIALPHQRASAWLTPDHVDRPRSPGRMRHPDHLPALKWLKHDRKTQAWQAHRTTVATLPCQTG